MGLPLPSSNHIIAKDETVIRKSNDSIVMTIRKKLKYLHRIQECLNNHSVLSMVYVEEEGKPILKVELEPKHEERS